MWTGPAQLPTLHELLPPHHQEKIPALPLEFQYFPVEILSKQFTKLNSNHQYRIYYLGPRPVNTLAMHKRYGCGVQSCTEAQSNVLLDTITFEPYQVNLKKIINCSFTSERLQANHHYKSALFYRAFEGMNPTLPLKNQYTFNSAFEAGNLDCVIKVKPNQFDLFLRIDSNTRGHTAWYYFSLKNGSKMQSVTLNICNLTKPIGLYDQGMKPFIFSKMDWLQQKKGWQQGGQNCKIQAIDLRYQIVYEVTQVGISYRLSFDYQFQHENDQVFFAYCIPYTYSQLQKDLTIYQKSDFTRKSVIGKSLSGLDLPILHITNHKSEQKRKKNIIITGRVHPGQTNSSHMLHGFINYLLGASKEVEQLRNKVNFFIIPMINPDGVILGNTRTGAAGKDLNRQFLYNKKELFPQIYHIKSFTAKLQKRYGVIMYIDFHGHSLKKNTFLYGPNYPLSHPQYYKCRVLPKLIQKTDPRFRFYSCSFLISQSKKTTARAVMFSNLKIPYAYTVESSIGLFYQPQNMKTMPFEAVHWQQMGAAIVSALFNFISALNELQQLIKERKTQRQKLKQQRYSTSKGKRLVEDEQLLSKNKKPMAFLQMMEDIKAATAQTKNFQEEVESDDYDDAEDMESYKLSEFHNLVIKGRERQKKLSSKIVIEQQDFNIIIPAQLQDDMTIEQKIMEQSKRKDLKVDKSIEQKRTITREFRSNTVTKEKKQGINRKSLRQSQKNRDKYLNTKNFVLSNKQRYNLATKNLFPIDDRVQILGLPKSIQIMRKEMKKGRGLINNLQQIKMKFLTSGIREESLTEKKNHKGPFLPIDQAKFRVGNRSSTGNFQTGSNSISLNMKQSRRKSQSHLQQMDAYMTLHGLEVDNLAMTITTFKHFSHN